MIKIALGINVVLLAVIALMLFSGFDQEGKIAYIDTAKLMNEYEGMKQARVEYRKKAQIWQANIDTLVNEMQVQIQEHEKNSKSMTIKENELSRQLIRTKQQQLGEYQKAIQEKARQADMEMTQQVLSTVNAYLQDYGKTHKYKIILATTEAGNIVYGEQGLDITEDVLKGLHLRNDIE
jgi:outer membrane protein